MSRILLNQGEEFSCVQFESGCPVETIALQLVTTECYHHKQHSSKYIPSCNSVQPRTTEAEPMSEIPAWPFIMWLNCVITRHTWRRHSTSVLVVVAVAAAALLSIVCKTSQFSRSSFTSCHSISVDFWGFLAINHDQQRVEKFPCIFDQFHYIIL